MIHGMPRRRLVVPHALQLEFQAVGNPSDGTWCATLLKVVRVAGWNFQYHYIGPNTFDFCFGASSEWSGSLFLPGIICVCENGSGLMGAATFAISNNYFESALYISEYLWNRKECTQIPTNYWSWEHFNCDWLFFASNIQSCESRTMRKPGNSMNCENA